MKEQLLEYIKTLSSKFDTEGFIEDFDSFYESIKIGSLEDMKRKIIDNLFDFGSISMNERFNLIDEIEDFGNLETQILVENGEMFEGTREQFMNCFFNNASDEQIKDWCFDNGWKLKIGETVIF